MNDIERMKADIEDLKKKISDLQSTTTLDIDIESAIRERLSYDNAFVKQGTGSYGTTAITIPSGGGGFTMPNVPSGTLVINIKGVQYEIPYK